MLSVNPVTVITPEPDVESEPRIPSGNAIAVYSVIGVSPVNSGAVNDTFATVFETMYAVTAVGAFAVLNEPRILKPVVKLIPVIIIFISSQTLFAEVQIQL